MAFLEGLFSTMKGCPKTAHSANWKVNVAIWDLRFGALVRVFQTRLSWCALRIAHRYRPRRHPSPLPDFPRALKNQSKEASLVRAPKARLYCKVLVAKCFPGCADRLCQGQPLSRRKCSKNVLGCDTDPQSSQTPQKIQRHEKVTQKWLSGFRWKWLNSDENGAKSHFFVTLSCFFDFREV